MSTRIILPAMTLILLMTCAPALAGGGSSIEELDDLRLAKSMIVKSIRDDVKKSMFTVKSRMPAGDLPELKFFRYRVKKGDTFWTIIARTSLDMDTLISVNSLSNPRDVQPGMTLFIPNMRGIILERSRTPDVMEYLKGVRVDAAYVMKANRTQDLRKEHLYVPCGRLTDLERSLFIGTGFMNPLESGRRTSGFGMRRNPFNNKFYQFHSGVDIACPENSKVYSAREGKVVFAGYEEGYGNLVIVSHEYEYYTYYGHLRKPLVKPGDPVKRGDCIALSGNTGRTTGPHLHFEVRRKGKPVNPGLLMKNSRGTEISLNTR